MVWLALGLYRPPGPTVIIWILSVVVRSQPFPTVVELEQGNVLMPLQCKTRKTQASYHCPPQGNDVDALYMLIYSTQSPPQESTTTAPETSLSFLSRIVAFLPDARLLAYCSRDTLCRELREEGVGGVKGARRGESGCVRASRRANLVPG
ncbi:hypothetical protein EDB92DRAFT_1270682 [Lactarius akahatsu]|uniref:Uncharacterized protein n=1 Tax=Lactarius akahatsu TaxID=416441 RepID=A0AAD4LEA4_9AGAM|nr:hypothetical protein EDB92DRAFT_1270682 [Lactarius akahatsu]